MAAKVAEKEIEILDTAGHLSSETSSDLLKDLRAGFGLSRREAREAHRVFDPGSGELESGKQKPGEQTRMRSIEMARLLTALARVVRRPTISGWLDAPYPAFDGLKPLEVIERGQVDLVWRIIFYLDSKTASQGS